MITEIVRTHCGEFEAWELTNDRVRLLVIPELGARICSLRSQTSGREWLWRPRDGRGLFRCAAGAAFSGSPLAGIDECLPTIAPTREHALPLPDHGEVWNRIWQSSLDGNALVTEVELQCLPLQFRRSLTLEENAVILDYLLTNRGSRPVNYIWSLHPLLAIMPGDAVRVLGSRTIDWPRLDPGMKLDQLELGDMRPPCLKTFIDTRSAPELALVSGDKRDFFSMDVDPVEVPWWGFWLNRSGWKDHTHFALEPCNAPVERPGDCEANSPLTTLQPDESRRWRVKIRVG